jgi:hypothetical protein
MVHLPSNKGAKNSVCFAERRLRYRELYKNNIKSDSPSYHLTITPVDFRLMVYALFRPSVFLAARPAESAEPIVIADPDFGSAAITPLPAPDGSAAGAAARLIRAHVPPSLL